jgi:hypothetical protein
VLDVGVYNVMSLKGAPIKIIANTLIYAIRPNEARKPTIENHYWMLRILYCRYDNPTSMAGFGAATAFHEETLRANLFIVVAFS